MITEQKEYYIVWFDASDVPGGILTGPFENTVQAEQVIDALQPLHESRRLTYVGGNLRGWNPICFSPFS